MVSNAKSRPLIDFRLTTLDNGVRVATSTIPHVQSVSLGIWVGVGSRHERGRLSGASHFIEHLLFKGTRTRSARAISQAIEGRGGYLNAFTQEEDTCYYARVAADQLARACDVLTDMYVHPLFDARELDKERGVILEEILMYADQPQQVVHEMLSASLWRNHPAGRPVIGSERTLKAISRADIIAFKQRNYVAENTLVAFAGKVDHAACVKLVARLLGRLPTHEGPGCRPVNRTVGQRDVWLKSRETEQTNLALGIRLFGYTDRRRYALKLLNVLLGENMSSRLFQVVREKHGLAYSIQSTAHLMRDTGAWVVSAGLDRARTPRALDLIMREMTRLAERPPCAAEFRRACDYVIGQTRLALESTTQHMMWIGTNLMCFGRFISPEESIDEIQRIRPSDVQALAATSFRKSRASLCLVTPRDDKTGEADLHACLGRLA